MCAKPSQPSPRRAGLSRRDFLKIAAVSTGSLLLRPRFGQALARPYALPEFPASDRLGRVAGGRVDLKARPDLDSETLGVLYDDAVVPWVREVVGEKPVWVFMNQRWIETPDGFIYAPYIQPVRNLPNQPVQGLPASELGAGMWAEVTVPYADIILEREASTNSWVEALQEEGLPLRVYYSQVFWVDQMKESQSGGVLYRVNPNFYGGVDMFWVPAEAMRPVTAEELEPISPEVTDKRVVVNVSYQTVSCYEGNTEVYFCRASTGAKFDMYGNIVDHWSTPVGRHRVTRKYISLQMSGGTTGAGYDLPGIGWTSIFATGGVALHSTFWHNNFGDPMSHGCVNLLPEDSKWIFRWTTPAVTFAPGMHDVTVSGSESTTIEVVEA